jgi:hypothetical protein
MVGQAGGLVVTIAVLFVDFIVFRFYAIPSDEFFLYFVGL